MGAKSNIAGGGGDSHSMGAVTKPSLCRAAGAVARHGYLKRKVGVQRSADGMNFDLRVQTCRRLYLNVPACGREDHFAGRVQLVEFSGDVAAGGPCRNRSDDLIYFYIATRRRHRYLTNNAAHFNIAARASG